MNRGVISVGTNSTRALVAAFNGAPNILLTRSTGTRIGEGLKQRGRLEEEPLHRTLEAIADHARAVRELTNDICFIGTSALRRAENAADFTQPAERLAGVPLTIISGQEEARRSFLGAVSKLDVSPGTTVGVIDTGGGSTEYGVGTRNAPTTILSCEIGAVRLTEEFPELGGTRGSVPAHVIQRAREQARQATAEIDKCSDVERLLFVGGTATTAIGLLEGKREMFDYANVTKEQVLELEQLLSARSLEERKALPGMNPQRADILLGGLIILEIVLERTGHKEALVTTNDLLLGTLLIRSLSDKNA
ncbi:MAG TPA: hypothetical protein VFE17_00990 [Candidatus Baltobacteraceae bacterium]|nr:hypothetical protein [Candidatus Baltobacteraceae bacterium]